MASGLVAALNTSSSVSYTPTVDSKLQLEIAATDATSVTVNSVPIFNGGATPIRSWASKVVFVGANTTVTIATESATTCIVSSLESV